MDDIGTRIRTAKKKRGLSQRALAKEICKCNSAISSYENNLQTPPLDVLISIAHVLNVSLNYLAGFDDSVTFSTAGLTEQQNDILSSLINEFKSPKHGCGPLSPEQIRILQQIILLFSK